MRWREVNEVYSRISDALTWRQYHKWATNHDGTAFSFCFFKRFDRVKLVTKNKELLRLASEGKELTHKALRNRMRLVV